MGNLALRVTYELGGGSGNDGGGGSGGHASVEECRVRSSTPSGTNPTHFRRFRSASHLRPLRPFC